MKGFLVSMVMLSLLASACGGGGSTAAKTSGSDTASSSDTGESIKQYCKDVKPFRDDENPDGEGLRFTLTFGLDSTGDTNLPKFLGPVKALAGNAPADVRSDWKEIGSLLDVYIALKKIGTTRSESEVLDHEDVLSALQNVELFTQDQCDFALRLTDFSVFSDSFSS